MFSDVSFVCFVQPEFWLFNFRIQDVLAIYIMSHHVYVNMVNIVEYKRLLFKFLLQKTGIFVGL